MADLFTRLARRTRDPVAGVVPRVPARFEPSTDPAGQPSTDPAGQPAGGGAGPAGAGRDLAMDPGVIDVTGSGWVAGEAAGQPLAAARVRSGPRPDQHADRLPGGGTGQGRGTGGTWPGASARPGGAGHGGRAGFGGTGPGKGAGPGGTGPGEGAGPGDGGPPGGPVSGQGPGTGPGVPVDLAAAARSTGRASRPRSPRPIGRPGQPAAPVDRAAHDSTPDVGIRPVPEGPAAEAAAGRGGARSVQISIGRIVVRAAPPAPPAMPAPGPAPRDGLSLSAYLRGDDGRPR
jgi:hypothetical protein